MKWVVTLCEVVILFSAMDMTQLPFFMSKLIRVKKLILGREKDKERRGILLVAVGMVPSIEYITHIHLILF